MSSITELQKLLVDELIPELEGILDEFMEQIADNKKATMDDKEDYKELQELFQGFKEILEDIESNELDEEEYESIIEDYGWLNYHIHDPKIPPYNKLEEHYY